MAGSRRESTARSQGSGRPSQMLSPKELCRGEYAPAEDVAEGKAGVRWHSSSCKGEEA